MGLTSSWPYVVAVYAVLGGLAATGAARIFSQRKASRIAGILACAIVALWVWHVALGRTEIALSLVLAWALTTLGFVDLLVFRLPDLITLPIIAVGLAAAQLLPGEHVVDHAAAAAIAFAAFWLIGFAFRRIRGREGLGLGDAKLAAAGGAWLGTIALPSVLLIASSAGILWVLLRALARGRRAFAEKIPFGVPLALAIWLVWLYGPLGFTLSGD